VPSFLSLISTFISISSSSIGKQHLNVNYIIYGSGGGNLVYGRGRIKFPAMAARYVRIKSSNPMIDHDAVKLLFLVA
jgi:hypothetical protein